MKRKNLALILLAAVALSGCAAASGSAGAESASASVSESASAAESSAVTFTDALDRTVTVENPQRVATLIGSFADVWCAAGGADTIVASADDTWTQFDLGLNEDIANIGKTTEPSVETLLAAQPDFVIASARTQADVDLLPTLEQAGIIVAYFDVSSFEDYLAMLKVCTDITGRADCYEQNGLQVQKQIEAVCESAEGKEAQTVLYMRATGVSCKVKGSEGTVLGEMLADLGCVNIADSETSLLEELSMEAILAADPDRIFIVMQGSDAEKVQKTLDELVLSNPAWQQLTAVREGRVHYMDQTLYNLKPNARWGEAYEGLAEILYGA